MNNGKAGKRGVVQGWSPAVARRNLQFLWSVRADKLDGHGYAFTLTVRNCPETPEEWARLVRRWMESMERTLGAVRIHWVIEWQRRGVPHLHGALYFDVDRSMAEEIVNGWCYLVGHGARSQGQSVTPITDLVGWLRYVAKHAARGVSHYQRNPEAIPEGWKGRTGRMWGHRGEWPCDLPQKVSLAGREGDRGYYAWRRLLRSWRIADARAAADWSRLRQARRMLHCTDRHVSEVRGVSEWVPRHLSEMMLLNLSDRGYAVQFQAPAALELV